MVKIASCRERVGWGMGGGWSILAVAIEIKIKCLAFNYISFVILEGARASTGLSLLCVDVGYKQWSNDRPLCA